MLTLQFAPTANVANIPHAVVPAPAARAPYQGSHNNRTQGGRPYNAQAPAPLLPGIHANGVPPAPPPNNNNRGRQLPNLNKWYNNHNYVVPRVATTSPSGTPAQPVMTESLTTKLAVTEEMLPHVKRHGMLSLNVESSTPSCRLHPPWNKPDDVGHRM